MSAPRHILAFALLGSSLPLQAQSLGDDPLLGELKLPTVLSATRLKQSPAEVPGSMTVLDRQLIRASGARDVPELMRLVPGMMVGYRSGNQMNVNLHGTNISEARRMQVLVDGRSVYRPGFATVEWSAIPLAIEDIERIEVFRGPNTAAYGANALMGVINIISRHPRDYAGTTLKYTQGDRGVSDWYGNQHFRLAQSDWRLSLSGVADDGFDLLEPGVEYRDSRQLERFNLSGAFNITHQQTLELQLAASHSKQQYYYDYEPYLKALRPSRDTLGAYDYAIAEHNPDSDSQISDYSLQGLWKNDINPDHSVQILAYAQQMNREQAWRACDSPIVFIDELKQLYDLNPTAARRVSKFLEYADAAYDMRTAMQISLGSEYTAQLGALGEAIKQARNGYRNSEPVCWDIDHNMEENRIHLEVQDTLRVNDQLRLMSGLSYRYDRATSETFFGGTVENHIVQGFGNLEYRPHARWLFQLGGMLEDDRLIGTSFSPRIAGHFFIAPLHSLRAVYSEAVRSPDMYENNAYWSYPIKNASGPVPANPEYYATGIGPGDLEQERMRAVELGYHGNFSRQGVSLDVRFFQERIDNMNSEPLKITDFYPNNNSRVEFRGGEAEVDWRLGYADRLRLTYAHIVYDASSKLDERLTPRHSGSAGWIHEWPAGFTSSLFYYGADELNERRFERADLRLEKRFELSASSALSLALTWQERLDDEALTWDENLYDSQSQYYLSAELSF
ncbi:TonB-dependent receptor plug domain-containing protein [Halopseudomonas maritima]|uniref:TonB-dependent receptor plug domain-containing protein n=1 Tax=Halopseudomonas maritima TaxID=2918528 RepID=UPI001EEC139E|nr:TonB-dependent receptor [Halopseudomonas maritima]UJJ31342.1 TonB-dependent receptor [Halopseudomonas maritima]